MDMALAMTMAMAMSMLHRMGVTGIGAVTQLFMPRSILLATSIYTTTHGRVDAFDRQVCEERRVTDGEGGFG